MPLSHFPEMGLSSPLYNNEKVSIISNKIDSKSRLQYGQDLNPEPTAPKVDTLALSHEGDC